MASRSRVMLSLLAGLIVLAPGTPALAGFDMVEATGTRTMISSGRIKIVPGVGSITFVIDVKADRLWLANSESSRLWEGTVAEYCEGLRRIPGAAAAGAPAASGADQVLVQSSEDVEWIAGLPARRYVVLVDGRRHEDVWLTPDLALADEMNIDRAAETFGVMLGCLAGGAKGDAIEARPEYTRMYRLGWPLKRVTYADAPGGPAQGSPAMLVTKIGRVPIPESEFAAPAGYQRAPLAEVLGANRRP